MASENEVQEDFLEVDQKFLVKILYVYHLLALKKF